jgi:pyruvate dehydrogenase E2 component (dihydrolipoamide acetyltransferase)
LSFVTEITMPRLSDSMEEGTILAWLLRDGDHVEVDDELVEIETDKATMTYQAEADGVLTIVAQQGDTLPVGAVIARLGAVASGSSGQSKEGPASVITPHESSGNGPTRPLVTPTLGSSALRAGNAEVATRVRATPLARRLAQGHDLDLAGLSGSGPSGRIRRADVAAALGLPAPSAVVQSRASEPRAEPVSSPQGTPSLAPEGPGSAGPTKGAADVVSLTRLQQLVARRMAETKATVPEFQVQAEVVMDAAIALRAQLKSAAKDAELDVPSLNDLIVKAAAIALGRHPRANGSYSDGKFELYSRVNVGVAVAADDALIVPTVFDADKKSLGTIAETTRRLAARVRDGSITPPELSGATFTVSNLGMYGMTAISPIINAPQAAILGVGAMRPIPAVVEGQLVERQVMTFTLTCDHRILYGADAARFLSAICGLLEQPLALVL